MKHNNSIVIAIYHASSSSSILFLLAVSARVLWPTVILVVFLLLG